MNTVNQPLAPWQTFVIEHGFRAKAYELAAVLDQPMELIQALRDRGVCSRLLRSKGFVELFELWHGRAPTDEEWPKPRQVGAAGAYEWLGPELALLASLIGQISKAEIADLLTVRLGRITGDPEAKRTLNAIQVCINKIGMQTVDVVGGLTTTEAAREIGSFAIINQMIDKGEIKTHRVGRLHVIPYKEWERWKSKRVFPPSGYIQLSTLREPLGLLSDKLSEYARMGLIPSAIRCNPYGTGGKSTQFGTWWISPETRDQLLADRRAGRVMPWSGKNTDNLRITFKLWQKRKHPATCTTCSEIWGSSGAPTTFEDYCTRYPDLAHGAKRHLTRPWSPGLTLKEVAEQADQSIDFVSEAVENGALAATTFGGQLYVSRTDATRWVARHCPSGEGRRSWLALGTACDQYFFTLRELRAFIETGELKAKIGTDGAMRGVEYVSRQQCVQLRERIGFTEDQAAQRLGITVARFRHLLAGVDWRAAEKIPLVTVQAVRKRLRSRQGYSVEEAADALGKTDIWVRARIDDGTVKISRATWDRRRTYLSETMMQRLRNFDETPAVNHRTQRADRLSLSEAAVEAGVSSSTLNDWGQTGELKFIENGGIRLYHRAAVRARARKYWLTARLHRATPPLWLQTE